MQYVLRCAVVCTLTSKLYLWLCSLLYIPAHMGFFTATVRRKRNMACFVFFNLDPVLTFSTDEEDDRSYIPYVDFQNLLVFILTCIYYFKIRLILCAIRLLIVAFLFLNICSNQFGLIYGCSIACSNYYN